MRHHIIPKTQSLGADGDHTGIGEDPVVHEPWNVVSLRDKTVAITGTFVGTVSLVGSMTGEAGSWVPVGYVSGSGEKTLTEPGTFVVPEAVVYLALKMADFTSGSATGQAAGFDSRTV